jgi:beta-glucanase (GH16 family)
LIVDLRNNLAELAIYFSGSISVHFKTLRSLIFASFMTSTALWSAFSAAQTISDVESADSPAYSGGHVFTPVDSTYELVFDDEFNGDAVNTAKWVGSSSAESDDGHGNEPNGQDEWDQLANCSVAKGLLTITALRQSYTSAAGINYPWTSCLLSTAPFAFQYGYMETRAKFPAPKGFWPGFWTWQAPDVDSWQETDAYEFYSDNHTALYLSSHPTGGGGTVYDLPFDPTEGFHVYGVNIQPVNNQTTPPSGGTDFYIDGVKVSCKQKNGALCVGPTAITNVILDMFVNNGINAPAPAGSLSTATMQIDYVHVYSKGATAVTPEEGYNGPGSTK